MAQGKKAQLSELNLSEILLLEEGHCLRDQALEVCQLSFTSDHAQRYRATSLETLRQLVSSGYGITLLPALSCVQTTTRLHLLKLESKPVRQIGFIWRNSDPRHEAFLELIDAIRYSLPQDLVKVLE